MSISVCVQGLVAEGRITKGQAAEVERYYDAHFNALKGQMDMMAAADLASEHAIKQMQGAINRRSLLAAKTIAKQIEIEKTLRSYGGGDPEGKGPIPPKALIAMLGSDDPHAPYMSLEARHQAIEAQIDGKMRGVIEQHRAHIWGSLRDKAGLDDLGREAFGQDTGNESTKQLAEAYGETRDWLRQRANAAGADIGKIEDHGLRSIWNSDQVRARTWEEFRADVFPELRRERMIDRETGQPFTANRLEEVARKVWEGMRSEGADDRPLGIRGGKSTASQEDAQRFWHFKDYDGWKRVNEKYGKGNTWTAMWGLLDSRAKNISAMEHFGPNADHGFRVAQDLVEQSHQIAEGLDSKGVNAAKLSAWQADAMWREFKGTLNQPGENVVAKAFTLWRNIKTTAVLGTAVVSQQSDVELADAARLFNGVQSANVLSRISTHSGVPYFELMRHWTTMLSGLKGGAEDREWAARMLVGLGEARHFTLVQSRRMGGEFGGPVSQRAVSALMRVQFAGRSMEVVRQMYATDFWNTITTHRGLTWDGLDPSFRAGLQRGGFDGGKWDALRASPLTDRGGSKWILPETIEDEQLRTLAAATLHQQLNTTLAMPDLRVRAAAHSIVNRYGGPGHTLVAETMRSLAMFKMFGASIMATQWQRMSAMEGSTLARYAARFALGMTLMGALEIQLRHLVKGEDPEDMTKPAFWGWALSHGGAGGLFADYLRNAMQDPEKGWQVGLSGPMAGDLQSAQHIFVTKGSHGDALKLNRNPGGAAYKFARSFVPGGSLWYARLAFDRMIGDEVQQMVDPNYRHSWQTVRDHARERGAPMWAPPGGPIRAPDLSNAVQQEPAR